MKTQQDKIIEHMTDIIPFELNPRLIPYIKECMQIYADQQSAIAVAKRDKEIREWMENNESGWYSDLLQFLSTPTEQTPDTQSSPINLTDFPRESDNPWCSRDVLLQLISASETLLSQYNYDGHSHEEIQISIKRAKEIVHILETQPKAALSQLSEPDQKYEYFYDDPKNILAEMTRTELEERIIELMEKQKQPF